MLVGIDDSDLDEGKLKPIRVLVLTTAAFFLTTLVVVLQGGKPSAFPSTPVYLQEDIYLTKTHYHFQA